MKLLIRTWSLIPLPLVLVLYFPGSVSCQLRLITPTPTPATEITKSIDASPISGMGRESTAVSVSVEKMREAVTITTAAAGFTVESNAITVSEEPNVSTLAPGSLNSSSFDIYNHPTVIKSFSLPPNYNKEMRPSKFGTPVSVEFEIHVQAINPIKAADMDFRMEVLFAFRWEDLRLHFEENEFYDSDHILLPPELIDSIWHPDPYILNAKSTEVGQLTGKLVKVYIFRNQTVVYSINLFVTVACAMQFQFYPFDYQLCPMVIESFSYDETKVKYKWSSHQKFTVNPRLRLLQFVVTYPLVAEECSIQRIKEDHNVSQLIAYFRFDRLLGNHLIQTFSPCSLVTALSWLSFWFELDAIPARVSLLITSLLILVTQFSGLKVDMPPVAYVKAVDIWMAGCMIFVFSALAEFVLVKIVYSKTEELKHMILAPHAHANGDTNDHGGEGKEASRAAEEEGTSTGGSSAGSINTISVRSSPLVTPSAISPVLKHNQVPQRVMSKENIGGSSSTFDFRSSQQQLQLHNSQPQVRAISQNPQPLPPHPPPPITLVRSLAMQNPKLGSSLIPQVEHVHTPRRIHAILNMTMPFCCGCLRLPLIWTNDKTKKTHFLWQELDRMSRWIFPVTFCIFLIVYWLVLFVHSLINAPPDHYGIC